MQRLVRDVHAVVRQWWDPSRRLLVPPGGRGARPATAWWAYGLLRRSAVGDREVAETALRGVLATAPAGGDDDGLLTGLALSLHDHDLPAPLDGDLRAHVGRAVAEAATVDPAASSAVVLRAWLELEVGRWHGDEDLLRIGGERAQDVAADAALRGHLPQHNCPTATGLTLLGLSLWAERPPVEDLAPLGRALRDEVWHDLLAAWHPGLRTMVPPFTRAQGMDLRAHVGATGLWLAWLVDGANPLPPLDGPLDHGHHLPLLFLVDALAGASEDVLALAPLVRAQPPRQGEWFDRVGERVWTGWTGGDLALGAEWSPIDWGGSREVVTAAAVWRSGDGDNAWLRVHQQGGAVRARVEHVDGVVRLVHGTGARDVQLWSGGGAAAVTSDRVELAGRTWQLRGVREVGPVDCDVPHVDGAWALSTTGDGIVLTTEA